MKRDEIRQRLKKLLEKGIEELQRMHETVSTVTDDASLWTCLDRIEHGFTEKLQADAGTLCNVIDDSCPDCGCDAGDGVTEGCEHPEGCGWVRDVHGAADEVHR